MATQASLDITSVYEGEHFALFYPSDDILLQNLRRFIGGGLKARRNCLVVATLAHRQALDDLLAESGLDPKQAKRSGQYVALDAATRLRRFVVNGLPDRGLFEEAVTAQLAVLERNHAPMLVFGEMVALLWQREEYAATIALENLWNSLIPSYALTQFCGYPAASMNAPGHESSAESIDQLHTTVLAV